MKKYDITIKFTLEESEYKRYSKNIDMALNLIIPYGNDVELKEIDYIEEDE